MSRTSTKMASCARKRRYATRRQALDVLGQVNVGGDLAVYKCRCSNGHHYHIGSSKLSRRRSDRG